MQDFITLGLLFAPFVVMMGIVMMLVITIGRQTAHS